MSNEAAQIDNIPSKQEAKQTGIFTSAISATAIISLTVVLSVMLLGRI